MSAWRRYSPRGKGQTAKMGNTRSTCAVGHSHRSKLESAVCQLLQLRVKAGEFDEIIAESHVHLTAARIVYVNDFACMKGGEVVRRAEAKGFSNDRWPIIKKLWKYYGDAPLEVWRGTYKRPMLDETVVPVTKGIGE